MRNYSPVMDILRKSNTFKWFSLFVVAVWLVALILWWIATPRLDNAWSWVVLPVGLFLVGLRYISTPYRDKFAVTFFIMLISIGVGVATINRKDDLSFLILFAVLILSGSVIFLVLYQFHKYVERQIPHYDYRNPQTRYRKRR